MPKALVNGVNHHYLQVGEGPAVLMIHGLAANLAFWSLRIAPLLAGEFQVTTYDLRGHGYSDMPHEGYNASDLADDLGALIDHLDLPSVHLVGHSFGGDVLLEYAVRHPERVQTVTLADAVVPALRFPAVELQRHRRRGLQRRLSELGVDLPDGIDGEELLDGLADPRWSAARQAWSGAGQGFAPFSLWNGGSRAAARWRELLRSTTARQDLHRGTGLTREQLRAMRRRALAIYGERSRYLPICRELERTLPDCRAHTIPDAGHFYPILKPLLFAAELRRFLLGNEPEGQPVWARARAPRARRGRRGGGA